MPSKRKPVAAPRTRVWQCLTRDLGRWWISGFFSLPGTKRMVLEPALGGRMFEDQGGGRGLVWYTVIGLVEGRRLVLAGDISAEFGGPARSVVTVNLEDAGKGTRVRLQDVLVGTISPKSARAIEGGWQTLLGKGLKPYAERAPRGR